MSTTVTGMASKRKRGRGEDYRSPIKRIFNRASQEQTEVGGRRAATFEKGSHGYKIILTLHLVLDDIGQGIILVRGRGEATTKGGGGDTGKKPNSEVKRTSPKGSELTDLGSSVEGDKERI